ncbi:hypothetical protein D3C75_1304120 [compost metagenome]
MTVQILTESKNIHTEIPLYPANCGFNLFDQVIRFLMLKISIPGHSIKGHILIDTAHITFPYYAYFYVRVPVF